jgi:hypothetical protein
VYYTLATWKIFNQGHEGMTSGARFFVFDDRRPRTTYTHEADAASIGGPLGNRTYLSHAVLDGDPLRQFYVTANWSPPGGPHVYDDHPLAVFYDSAVDLWAIVNADNAPMPVGTSFNVWIP